ncbi:hypothetical protein QOZ80_1BG0070710 [Eleusine coracana subsp. coracana]|nr:hypothetical protein QOZ80_1BG0070710 [Eleusine coracana subsp. coracana]
MENVMSSFVLRRFCDLIVDGVKTDKGFKEVHLNSVARDLKNFIRHDVTGTQVYNHLCKWRARWVKICRLKNLNETSWDEHNFMVTLSPDHYYRHIYFGKFDLVCFLHAYWLKVHLGPCVGFG